MDIIALRNELEASYRPDLLAEIYRENIEPFLKERPELLRNWGIDFREVNGVYIRKELLAKILANILSERAVLLKWFGELPDTVSRSITICAWRCDIEVGELENAIGSAIFPAKSSNDSERIFLPQPGFKLLQLKRFVSKWPDDIDHSYYLSLPDEVSGQLRKILPLPEGISLDGGASRPTGKYHYQDMEAILRFIQPLSEFIRAGMIERTKMGLPRRTALSKIQKSFNLREFFISNTIPRFKRLRTELLVNYITTRDIELKKDPEDIIKMMFREDAGNSTSPVISLLDNIKGWQYTSAFYRSDTHANLIKAFQMLPETGWVAFDSFREFLFLRRVDVHPVSHQEADRHLYTTEQWTGWGNKKNRIGRQMYDQHILMPFLSLHLFLAAAFGLFDLVYNDFMTPMSMGDKGSVRDTHAGIVAFKLTKLGNFVFRDIPYSPAESQKCQRGGFTLDENRLLLGVSSTQTVNRFILNQVAEIVAPSLYRVTPHSFIDRCKSPADLERMIALFEQEALNEIPDIWRDLFDQLRARFIPLQPEEDVAVYRLPDDPELLSLVSRDLTLSKLVKRGEGRRVIIKTGDIIRFKSRLRELGFIV